MAEKQLETNKHFKENCVINPDNNVETEILSEKIIKLEGKKEDKKSQNHALNMSSLHRLINSPLCDTLMILNYLHSSKEVGIKEYICNKLFDFDIRNLKLYLSQIINILIFQEECMDFLRPLLITKSQNDPLFSLMCIWELENHLLNLKVSNKHSQSINEIYKQILTIQVVNSELTEYPVISPKSSNILNSIEQSDLINISQNCNNLNPPPFVIERTFVYKLLIIGEKLRLIKDVSERKNFLLNELHQINRNLPDKRIYIPWLHINPHYVLHLNTEHYFILNSKNKAPFLIFIEISYVNDENKESLTNDYRNNEVVHDILIKDIYSSGHYFSAVNSMNGKYRTNYSDVTVNSEEYIEAIKIRQAIDDNYSIASNNSANYNTEKLENRQKFSQILQEIEDLSKFKEIKNRSVISLIIKTGEDLRQEFLASQLLFEFQKIWKIENIPVWIRPFEIITASLQGGFIECINDTLTIHQIKKIHNLTLSQYFIKKYGPFESEKCFEMRKNFSRSCAAYCVVQYILQLKDRHNGNILIDPFGHIIHIDFGFMLGNSPRGIGFEKAPFKLTTEMIEVMGSSNSDHFVLFRTLLLHSFFAIRKHHDRIIGLVSIMSENKNYPCFQNSNVIQYLKERFHIGLNDEELTCLLDSLISGSIKSTRSKLYDSFQYYTNGIL